MSKSITVEIPTYKAIKIINDKGLEEATEVLSRLNKTLDDLTEEKEKLTKPMNEALKEIRARYKPAEMKLEEAINQIRKEMSSYRMLCLAEKKKAEEKAAKALASGKVSIEAAVALANKAGNIIEKVETKSGSVTFRVDKVLKIVKPALIPKEFLIPDEKRIKEALLAGATVAGCVLEEVQTVINKR